MYVHLLRTADVSRQAVQPERAVRNDRPVEQRLLTGLGHAARIAYPSARVLRRVPAGTNLAARTLAGCTDEELQGVARELAGALRRNPVPPHVLFRLFALVREAAGRTLGMRHYDVQLMGGWALYHGMLAEMETGEGKTLTATLPAVAAALGGVPVHIVTVNDYLAARDAEAMGPLYRQLGLTVATVIGGMSPDERRAAYRADITYVTNKELVFDYLRDQLTLGRSATNLRRRLGRLWARSDQAGLLVLRGLHFAIVDEADSVLIDEARTPLIISRRREDPLLESVFRSALDLARTMTEGSDYLIETDGRTLHLTPAGLRALQHLPVVGDPAWDTTRRRRAVMEQALTALHVFHRDREYLVKDGKIQIIDEYTGRVMPDRSWEQGLHQLIETKEGLPMTGLNETIARMSYQRFFSRYLRIAGMTGTAREVARELWSVYRLPVIRLPTHRPLRRRLLPDQITLTTAEKWSRVMARIEECLKMRRPVLVGTRSVADSDHLSALLSAAGIPHRVLNARQDEEEAAIIAEAGQPGQVTVATNMAGRGTDIRLADTVPGVGGLSVIATQRHDARRIDRQLSGRCARQGDPGSAEVIMSLEDELIRTSRAAGLLRRLVPVNRISRHTSMRRMLVYVAQISAERQHHRVRKELLKSDQRLEQLLAFAGRAE